MQRHLRTSRWISQLALACVLGAGCMEHSQPATTFKLPPPKPQHVDFANLSAHTSAVYAGASVNADELLARVAGLLKEENSEARVLRLVQRFPDAALEVLRNTSAAQVSQPERTAVAMGYDRAFIAAGSYGWTKAFMDAAVIPDQFQSVHQTRAQYLQLIESGHPEAILKLQLPAQSKFALAEADLRRLRGIAALLCDRTGDALQAWTEAAELAAADHAVRAELYLLESEALRHDGSASDSEVRWSAAATAAVAIRDPGLWERLLAARGESAAWPSAVITSFTPSSEAAPAVNGTPRSERVEAWIWRRIGEWRFTRGETPAALIAFKQAEALFVLPAEKADARIAEARALLTMNQSGAATSMLTSLATDSDPLISHRALAVLGNARIALDDIPGALTLLQAAVANDDSLPIAMRAPGRADLGLVYLMSSREKEGLAWLHRAQADFEAEHDNASLVQSLRNEAAYCEQKGQSQQAASIRSRASHIAAAF